MRNFRIFMNDPSTIDTLENLNFDPFLKSIMSINLILDRKVFYCRPEACPKICPIFDILDKGVKI